MGVGAEPDRRNRAARAPRALRRLRAGWRTAWSDGRGGSRRPYRAADRMAQRLSALVSAVVHRRRDRMAMVAGERRVAAQRTPSMVQCGLAGGTATLSPHHRTALYRAAGKFSGVLVHLHLDAELPAHCARTHAAGERPTDDLDADRGVGGVCRVRSVGRPLRTPAGVFSLRLDV